MSISPNEKFPLIEFSGQTPRERGYEHGTILHERINAAIKVYQKQFSQRKHFSEKLMFNLCEQYRKGIATLSNDYVEELDSIAISSKQHPLWIIALNSRLEILNHLALGAQNECTVLYDERTCELAENWDWVQDFEHLAFVNHIKSNGILQMTEPGVLGKIGLNSYGIGITINFVDPLMLPFNHSYIPLHVTIRNVLDKAKTFDEALTIFERNGPGFGGHVLVADDQHQCCCVEFPGDTVCLTRQHPYHTNHFLCTHSNSHINDEKRYRNSLDRYERIKQLWNNRKDIEAILLDHDDSQMHPICRLYGPTSFGSVGTVCSLIMNLKERSLSITKGNPRHYPSFSKYLLSHKKDADQLD